MNTPPAVSHDSGQSHQARQFGPVIAQEVCPPIGGRTWMLALVGGDDPATELLAFMRERSLVAASLQGYGCFREATLGWFNPQKRDYERVRVDEQTEVVSLLGVIAEESGRLGPHVKVVLAKRDGSTFGGHLLEATVSPTLEILLTELPRRLRRRHDPSAGTSPIDVRT